MKPNQLRFLLSMSSGQGEKKKRAGLSANAAVAAIKSRRRPFLTLRQTASAFLLSFSLSSLPFCFAQKSIHQFFLLIYCCLLQCKTESEEMGKCVRGGGDFWRGEDEGEKERRRKGGWGNTEGSSCLFKAGCSDAQSYPADQLAYLNPRAARGSRSSTLLGGTSEGGGFWMRTQESSKRSVFPIVWTATKMTWSSNFKLKRKRKSFTFFFFFGYREGGQTNLLVFSVLDV